MTHDIWSITRWYVYVSPQGFRAFPRALSPRELRSGEALIAVHTGVSRKTAIERERTAAGA